MARVVEASGFSANDFVSYSDFRLCCDIKEKKLSGEKMKSIVEKAEKWLDTPVNILEVTHYKLYETKGDRKETQGGYFERRNMALDLAYAECYERQGRFTEKLINVIWAIMEESTWVIPAHHRDNTPYGSDKYLPGTFREGELHGICLFSATTAADLAMIYHLCADILDDYSTVINEKIKYCIRQRISYPFIQCRYWWLGDGNGRVLNWCPWITSNILLAVGLTESDEYIRQKVAKRALLCVDNYIDRGVKADGGSDEGPGYWGAAGASLFDCLELLYDLSGGKINVYERPEIKNMLEFIVKINIHGKRFVNFSDCPAESLHDGDMIRRMGEKCGSDALCSFGDVMTEYNSPQTGSGHPYRAYRSLITEKLASVPESLGLKKMWLPEMKIMTARENSETGKGIFVSMVGGTNATAHSHNDIGSISVYYNGNPVIIDTGAGVYTRKTFSKDRYTLWYMQSQYHNVADVNGIGQRNGADYHSSKEEYNEATGRVKMELATAYPTEAGLESYVRECVLDVDTVRLTDSFVLKERGNIDIHFITHKMPQLSDDGSIMLAEGRRLRYSASLTPEIEEYEAGDPHIESRWGAKTLFRIHLRAEVLAGSFNIEIS